MLCCVYLQDLKKTIFEYKKYEFKCHFMKPRWYKIIAFSLTLAWGWFCNSIFPTNDRLHFWLPTTYSLMSLFLKKMLTGNFLPLCQDTASASGHTWMELISLGTSWKEWTHTDDKLWRITLPGIPNIFVEPRCPIHWIFVAIYSRLRETSWTAIRSEFLTARVFDLYYISVVGGRKMCLINKLSAWRCMFACPHM